MSSLPWRSELANVLHAPDIDWTWERKLAGSVGVQLLADILLILFIILLVAAGSRLTHRRHLRRFLGIPRGGSGRIRILLSNIYVKRSGTLSLNMTRQGFFGYALTESEYFYALKLAEALRTRPFGRLYLSLLDKLSESPADATITTEIQGSPGYIVLDGNKSEIVQRPDREIVELLSRDLTIILVGSPLYNSAVDYVLSHAKDHSRFRFYRPDPGPDNIGYAIEVFPQGKSGGSADFFRKLIRDPSDPFDGSFKEYSFIQKIADKDLWKASVFLCAGTSTASTTAALEALANWRQLFKEFGEKPFGILFETLTSDREVSVSDGGSRPDGWVTRRVLHYVE